MYNIYTEPPLRFVQLGKGKGTPYLTSEFPLLSREYSPRKPTEVVNHLPLQTKEKAFEVLWFIIRILKEE